MSAKEAAGYLFQLRDLYSLYWTARSGEKVEYRRLTTGGVEALLHSSSAFSS
jgi:hypothetical protein